MALMAGTTLEDSVVSGAAVAEAPDPEVLGCPSRPRKRPDDLPAFCVTEAAGAATSEAYPSRVWWVRQCESRSSPRACRAAAESPPSPLTSWRLLERRIPT